MFNIKEKLDSTVFAEKVILPPAGGFLLALLIMPLFGMAQLNSAIGVLLGLSIGALIGFGIQTYRGNEGMDEFEKRISEKAGLISFAILLILVSGNIAWKLSMNQSFDQNLLYIALGSSLIYSIFRFKGFWPGSKTLLDQREEIKQER